MATFERIHMKFGVVVFPGSNCDDDTVGVIQSLGHEAVKLWHKDTDLQNCEFIIIQAASPMAIIYAVVPSRASLLSWIM